MSELIKQVVQLPPADMRWGGPRYREDEEFLRSAKQSASSLISFCGLSEQSRVLDIGCGQGRLLYGILEALGSVEAYHGVDVHEPSISWAKANIEEHVPFATFELLDYRNERYNPQSDNTLLTRTDDDCFDVITLYSVFSHMRLADIKQYLKFIRAALEPESGKCLLTLFVENEVEPEEENPDGYHREWSGSLHCVRINRQLFEKMIHDSGLQISMFMYRTSTDGQSLYVLQPMSSFEAKVYK